jgi:hypothetical protein
MQFTPLSIFAVKTFKKIKNYPSILFLLKKKKLKKNGHKVEKDSLYFKIPPFSAF